MNLTLMKSELTRDEGVRLKPYIDTAGKLTIGIGRNLDDVGVTAAEADFLLTNDVVNSMQTLDMALPWWKDLSEVRQRALLNMMFNMGWHTLMEFKDMLFALKTSDWEKAAQEARNSIWAREVGDRAERIATQFING